jgi:hypothetical protein
VKERTVAKCHKNPDRKYLWHDAKGVPTLDLLIENSKIKDRWKVGNAEQIFAIDRPTNIVWSVWWAIHPQKPW